MRISGILMPYLHFLVAKIRIFFKVIITKEQKKSDQKWSLKTL